MWKAFKKKVEKRTTTTADIEQRKGFAGFKAAMRDDHIEPLRHRLPIDLETMVYVKVCGTVEVLLHTEFIGGETSGDSLHGMILRTRR